MRSALLALAAPTIVACSPGSVSVSDSEEPFGETSTCPAFSIDRTAIAFSGAQVGVPVEEPLTVTNDCTGEGNLRIETAIDGDPSFALRTPLINLDPGASQTFTVMFTAPDNGSHTGYLLLVTNDSAHPIVEIALAGTAGEDADGDGYAAEYAGGDDCDDADATVHPGADDAWYDGIDGNCDGADDYDQDADGARSDAHGGVDCDDTDPLVSGASPESLDGLDNDCDVLVDEDFLASGDVVVSEIMHHPLAVSDTVGEWFEVRNTTDHRVDLVGWTVSGDDGDVISIRSSLVVAAGGTVVLGTSADSSANGGLTVHYAYDRNGLQLSAADNLILAAGALTVFDVEWSESWPSADGASLSLDPNHLFVPDARVAGSWCLATSVYGAGDKGTPGSLNDQCTNLDEDGDGYSLDDGDCDDANEDVSPGEDEVWDAADNDCNGLTDDAQIGDAAIGEVEGSTQNWLTASRGLSVGDITGDTTPDLVVAGSYVSSYAGIVYVYDGDDASTLSGSASSSEVATITGETYNYLGSLSPEQGDQDGNGTTDLAVAGADRYGSYYDTVSVLLFEGGSGISGSMDMDDADVVVDTESYASGYGDSLLLSDIDLDGDGADELIYSAPWDGPSGRYASGAVYVLDVSTASGTVDLDDADGVYYGDSSQDYLGYGLGGGDMDGDGRDDVYLGAAAADDAASNGGAWYLVRGAATLDAGGDVDDEADSAIFGDAGEGGIGFGTAAVGDYDHDGALDLAFGGYGSDAAYVFFDADSLASEVETSDADVTLSGDAGGSFGFAVAVGDANGDGADDLLAGDPAVTGTYSGFTYWWYAAGSAEGVLYLFDGPSLTHDGDASDLAAASLTGEDSGDLFGATLSGVADFTGDGTGDFMVGAPRQGSQAGKAYVVAGL